MSAQRYTDPRAHARMSDGLCPECGEPANDHSGGPWGGCSLRPEGVAHRIAQYRADQDAPPAPTGRTPR